MTPQCLKILLTTQPLVSFGCLCSRLLTAINLLNHLDRHALTTVFPLLRAEWNLSDASSVDRGCLYAGSHSGHVAGWLAGRPIWLRVDSTPGGRLWEAWRRSRNGGQFWQFLVAQMGTGLADGRTPCRFALLGGLFPKSIAEKHCPSIRLACMAAARWVSSWRRRGERLGWRWVLSRRFVGCLCAVLMSVCKSRIEAQRLTAPGLPHGQRPAVFACYPLPIIFLGSALVVFATTALASWCPPLFTAITRLGLQAGLTTGFSFAAGVLGLVWRGGQRRWLARTPPLVCDSGLGCGVAFIRALAILSQAGRSF